MRKTVFVVDDSDTNLLVAEEALEKHFRVLPLPSAEKMFFMMQRIRPDLILLDIDMPVMDGFEAIKILKIDNGYKTIPVMFLTSYNDAVTEVRGFELGAVDFISKPFSPPVLINRIRMHLEIGELIKRRTEELTRLQNGIILTLTDVIESRNQGAEVHVEYTAGYIKILVDAMVARGIYAEETKKINFDSARLHDVGKIAIPDVILNKPGPLTGDEFTIMKTHAAEGEKIIDQIIDRIGSVDFLSCARVFAGAHHERFDGSGYPNGLRGEKIPLEGRIMAIADVYDALVSTRPYKKAFSEDEAARAIARGAGGQFDPAITEAFLSVKDEFYRYRTGQKGSRHR